MQRRSSERFNFGWVKLEYDKLGKFKPFIARYQWRDTTDNFGSFHSNSIGASYALLPQLAIEGGLAQTPDKNVQYIQFHWTPEYKIWTKGERGARSGAGASPASGLPPQLLPHRQP